MRTRDELDAIRGHIMGVNVRVLPGPNANAGDTIATWVTACGSAAVDEIFAQAALAADLAASEAEMREALNGVWALRDKHGKLWALLMNALQASPSPRAAAYQAARDRFEAALAMAVGKGERHDA